MAAVRTTASSLLLLVCVAPALACGGGDALSLDLEIKDTKPDELQLVVKTLPGAEISFDGQIKTAGERAGDSFAIKKSALKLGTNRFAVGATLGVLFSKKSAIKTVTWEGEPKSLLRFRAPATVADPEGTMTCEGLLCGSGSFRATKAGKLVLEAGGAKATDTLTLAGGALGDLAARHLADIEKGPVAFAGETPGGDPADALVVLGFPGAKILAVGKPVKLQEVDFVDRYP